MDNPISFGTGVALRMPSDWGMYLASPGMADPKILLRTREGGKPMLQFDRCVFRFLPAVSDKKMQHADSFVAYGRSVFLVHVYSGLYVTIVRKPSETNSSHFRVALMSKEDAGSACRFRVTPRYKIRVEGDTVCDKDMLFIQQDTSSLSLYASAAALQSASKKTNVDDAQVEVSASDTPTPFEIVVYDTTQPDTRHPQLCAGAGTLLFHREKDALLTIPTTVSGDGRRISKQQKGEPLRRNAPTASSPSRSLEVRGKLVPFFQHSQTPVATPTADSIDYGCNMLWFFENVDPTVGGRIGVGAPCRIRHGASGKYLTAQKSLLSGTFEVLLQQLETADQVNNSVFEVDLVAASVFSQEIISTKSFIRLKHRASQMYLSTMKATAATSSVCLSPTANLEDTLAIIVVPKARQQELSFLIGNVEFLAHYIRRFYEMQDPHCPLTVKDAAITRVVQQAASSLSALICFCTESEDGDPLTREGLPIPEHQESMFEVSLHKTAMDVLLCPFVGATKENKMELPLSGGVLRMEDVLLAEYENIYTVCRLCYRLLKQMSKGSPYSSLLVDYVSFMQAQEGYKLHVADTLMEIFTDNPNLPPSRMEMDIRHFVKLLLKKGRSSGYLKFLSMLCVVKETGVESNQVLVSQLLLDEHKDEILLKTHIKDNQLYVAVPVAKKEEKKSKKEEKADEKKAQKEKSDEKPKEQKTKAEKKEPKADEDGGSGKAKAEETVIALGSFLEHGDSKLVKFYEASIELLATLCIGGNEICLSLVRGVISDQHICIAIDSAFPASNRLRASFFLLAHHLYVREALRVVSTSRVTTQSTRCGSLVIETQPAHKTDDEVVNVTSTIEALLRNVKSQALAYLGKLSKTCDGGSNQLTSTICQIWHAVVTDEAYADDELVSAVHAAVDVLDGRSNNVTDRYRNTEDNADIMQTKIKICDFLMAVLQNQISRISDSALHLLISGEVEKATSFVEEKLKFIQDQLFVQSTLFPILLDLLMYQSKELVSQAMELLVAVCNAGGTIAQRCSNAELVIGEENITAFECFSRASMRLQRNLSVSGNILNEQAIVDSIFELVTFEQSQNTSARPRSTSLIAPTTAIENASKGSSSRQRFQAKVQALIAMRRVFGNVLEKRSRWRAQEESQVYAQLLFRSGIHEFLFRVLRMSAPSSEMQLCVLKFFRVLSVAKEASPQLSKNLDMFVQCLRDEKASTDAACIILRLLRHNKALAESLEEETIVQFVALLGFASDPAIAEGLEHVVLGEYPIPRNQKLVLQLLISNNLTKTIGAATKDWTASQLALNSAVVDLMACCCVSNSAARSIALRVLSAQDVMKMLLSGALPPSHIVPYYKYLCSACLASEEDWTAQELQQLKKQWTEDTMWWTLVKTVVIPQLKLTSETDEMVFCGMLPSISSYFINNFSPLLAQKSRVSIPLDDVGRALLTFAQENLNADQLVKPAYLTALSQAVNAVVTHENMMRQDGLADSLRAIDSKLNDFLRSDTRVDDEYPGLLSSGATKKISGSEKLTEKWGWLSRSALGSLMTLYCGGKYLDEIAELRPDLQQLHGKMISHILKFDLSEMAAIGTMATLRWAVMELEPVSEKRFCEGQIYLNSIGTLEMITNIISSATDDLRAEAFALAIAVLEGGNRVVQDQLLNHFTSTDEKLFHDLGGLIRNAISLIEQQRAREMHGTFYSDKSRGKLQFKFVVEAFRFLQLLCEGHHLGMQDYLRIQSDNLRSVNVVREVTQFLQQFVGRELDIEHVPLLLQTLALLTEVCQGPCRGNQQLIVSSGTCAVLNVLLVGPTFAVSAPYDSERADSLLQIKHSAITVVLALLEGVKEENIPLTILSEVPIRGIDALLEQLTKTQEFADGENEDLCEVVYGEVITLHTIVQCIENKTSRAKVEAKEVLDKYSSCVGMLGKIEIERQNNIEKVYFRVPTICSLLTEERKQQLLWAVDRSTQGSKLSDFLDKADELIFDLEATSRVNEQMKHNLVLKLFSGVSVQRWDDLSLAIAAAINVLFLVVISDARGLMDRQTEWLGVEGFIRVLSYVQVSLTLLVAIIDGSLNFPLLIYKETKEKEHPTLWDKAKAILGRKQTIYRFAFVGFSLTGILVSEFFFAVHLLGLISRSSVLKSVTVAVSQNGKSLLLTAMLGCIIVYLFSIVGFVMFPEHFENSCGTLSQCVVHILATGLRQGGGIGDAMSEIKYGEPFYFSRLVYDFAFWAIMIVIFLNILFGIIIDTFAELRDERNKKEEDMKTKCFICGIDSYTFDRYGEGFEKHVKEEHNLWQYLYFLHHLRRKEKSEYTGQESYVAERAEAGDIAFFPAGKASGLKDPKMIEEEKGSEEAPQQAPMAAKRATNDQDVAMPLSPSPPTPQTPMHPELLQRILERLEAIEHHTLVTGKDNELFLQKIQSDLQQQNNTPPGPRRPSPFAIEPEENVSLREELRRPTMELETALKKHYLEQKEISLQYTVLSTSVTNHLTTLLELFNETLTVKLNGAYDMALMQSAFIVSSANDLRRQNSLLTIELDGMRAQREEERRQGQQNSAVPADRMIGPYAQALHGLMRNGENYMQLLRTAVHEGRALYDKQPSPS